jgi:hypothetical protein
MWQFGGIGNENRWSVTAARNNGLGDNLLAVAQAWKPNQYWSQWNRFG